jgi:hypothetical protein
VNKDTEDTASNVSDDYFTLQRSTHFDAKTSSIDIVTKEQIRIVIFNVTTNFKQLHQIVLAAQTP